MSTGQCCLGGLPMLCFLPLNPCPGFLQGRGRHHSYSQFSHKHPSELGCILVSKEEMDLDYFWGGGPGGGAQRGTTESGISSLAMNGESLVNLCSLPSEWFWNQRLLASLLIPTSAGFTVLAWWAVVWGRRSLSEVWQSLGHSPFLSYPSWWFLMFSV